MTTNIQTFVRFTADRSHSNLNAIKLLCDNKLYGQAITVLRQELDSLTRVCYLLAMDKQSERDRLINDAVSGERWRTITDKGKWKIIQDSELVELASKYNHWAVDVYRFGNNFTHLTMFHDYKTNDPIQTLDNDYKEELKEYLLSYHGYPREKELTFERATSYIPEVAAKVTHNLSSYLNSLQAL